MRIHHVAYRTSDVARLATFYERVLGLEVRKREEDRVWLAVGDAILMIERRAPGEAEIAPGSLELLAFAVSAAERDAFGERFATHGVTIEARTTHTVYVRDPDGRRIAVSSYPFEGSVP